MTTPCPICQRTSHIKWDSPTTPDSYFSSTNYSIASSAKFRLPIFVCPNCHHGFSSPPPQNPQLLKFYQQAPTDQFFLQEETGRRRAARAIIRKIRSLPINNPATLIDLGCGPGLFLSEAQKSGFTIHGLESSNWAYQFATSRLKLTNIHHGSTEIAFSLPRQSFDVVTALDLIEHLTNPHLLLKACQHLLKKTGLLVITTPRFDSVLARLTGKNWHAIFPEHLHYFSSHSIKYLLTSNNFSITKTLTHTRYFSVNYLLSRLLNKPFLFSFFPFNQILPVNLGDELEIYASSQN